MSERKEGKRRVYERCDGRVLMRCRLVNEETTRDIVITEVEQSDKEREMY